MPRGDSKGSSCHRSTDSDVCVLHCDVIPAVDGMELHSIPAANRVELSGSVDQLWSQSGALHNVPLGLRSDSVVK